MLIVQKFGGTSLMDEERIRNAARRAARLAQQGHRVVMVVSAQGHTTDRLIAQANAINPKASPREMDAYLAVGEQLSAGLMAMALDAMGYPAVSLTGWQAGLVTDGNHANARVRGLLSNRIERELDAGKIAVVTGFQGISDGADITTLGRGGSDTTAVALAAFLGADVCRIYTDVDGVYDKDPRTNPDAVKYDVIGYDEMLTLARHGAQVLHDRCVELAKEYQVTIEVLSSFHDAPGTLVTDAPKTSLPEFP